jgi:purine-nucleoside phosphorylase
VLLPGDPLRARFIAEHFLADSVCYNTVRGMLGFTGWFAGQRVSVQGTGMGMPSLSIYANELITEYGCKILVRVGSCGALQDHVAVRDVILALGASTDSNMNKVVFQGLDYAPVASFDLLSEAHRYALSRGIPVHVGGVLTSDAFYNWAPDPHSVWRQHGVLGVEMETAALYTLASRHACKALSILTVSDHLSTHETLSAQEREKTFLDMAEIALHTVTAVV